MTITDQWWPDDRTEPIDRTEETDADREREWLEIQLDSERWIEDGNDA